MPCFEKSRFYPSYDFKHGPSGTHNDQKMAEPLKLGFVGLGAMGLPMASNLISKAPGDSTLFVYDILEGSMNKLARKHPKSVEICRSPREVAQKAVSRFVIFVSDPGQITLAVVPCLSKTHGKIDRKLSSPCFQKDLMFGLYT